MNCNSIVYWCYTHAPIDGVLCQQQQQQWQRKVLACVAMLQRAAGHAADAAHHAATLTTRTKAAPDPVPHCMHTRLKPILKC